MKQIPNLTYRDFSDVYLDRHMGTYSSLKETLMDQRVRFECLGFMLLECQMMDSSRCGRLTILPYGPNNTYKEIPNHPLSPRGLASDMSIVMATMDVKALDGPEPTPIESTVQKLGETEELITVKAESDEAIARMPAVEAMCSRWRDETGKEVALWNRNGQCRRFKPRATEQETPKKKTK